MGPITISTILSHGLTLFINTTSFLLGLGAVALVTDVVTVMINRRFGSITCCPCNDCRELVQQPAINERRIFNLAILAYLTVTLVLAIASYWISISFRQCILASSMGILALELAIPVTLRAFEMVVVVKTAVGVVARGDPKLNDDPPPYEAAVEVRHENTSVQGMFDSNGECLYMC